MYGSMCTCQNSFPTSNSEQRKPFITPCTTPRSFGECSHYTPPSSPKSEQRYMYFFLFLFLFFFFHHWKILEKLFFLVLQIYKYTDGIFSSASICECSKTTPARVLDSLFPLLRWLSAMFSHCWDITSLAAVAKCSARIARLSLFGQNLVFPQFIK